MSRSGYSDDSDNHAMWRGQVASAIRGKRGQAFLRELVEALDAMPEKRLIANNLIVTGRERSVFGVCAIGSVGVKRGIQMEALDAYNYDAIADTFGIAHQLVREIAHINDDDWSNHITPEDRWQRVRNWAASNLRDTP
jgi:hypothetical protein